MSRSYNFAAGPATLPTGVLETVQKELLDYQGTGTSLMEMSHRGKIFDAVYQKAVSDLRRIAGIPERFDILFMTGGASTQFALIPLNLSGSNRKAGYINTGAWSKKAIEQAKIQKVNVHEVASSADSNFNYIPDSFDIVDGLDYIHMTSNNTIFGTQFQKLPDPGGTKLVIDMSSDFLSKPIDWTHIGMAYAGTQKNAGPSGLTVVVIDKDYYDREREDTPTIFRYSTFAKNDSMYNTPPTFQIYVFGLVLEWLDSMGGLKGIQQHNESKAALIYDVIDSMPEFFLGHARKDSRSLMNITWNFPDKELDPVFLKGADEKRMPGLKGHRSVGGLRASVYNAMPKEGCQALADYMQAFAGEHKK
ncbi:MAG: 3-phosphoserine/phosphohydroxythreonine transaminase [Leptospiraceae bacterium]|nr:3-phosphoserine/phosphohydroxythreonine transaminase [Leptospiraceae bacterium]